MQTPLTADRTACGASRRTTLRAPPCTPALSSFGFAAVRADTCQRAVPPRRLAGFYACAPASFGTPEQVAEKLIALEEVGLDLVLLQFSPQIEEMERFAGEVIPLVNGSRSRAAA